eukprot:Skav235754  [mRNA]  locus=scaffold803:136389:138763:- [translate_table: standard]
MLMGSCSRSRPVILLLIPAASIMGMITQSKLSFPLSPTSFASLNTRQRFTVLAADMVFRPLMKIMNSATTRLMLPHASCF